MANQRKQGHNEVTRNPSQLVLISTTRYKIVSLSQRAMLTSQAFRDTFPLLTPLFLKDVGALLKDSPCSFSLGGYATAHNPPEALTQPPTTQMVVSLKTATWLPLSWTRRLPLSWTRRRPPFDAWHHSFHPDGNSPSFHPDISYPESCPPTFHPLGYLTSRILSADIPSTRISHIRNPVRRHSVQPDISHPESCRRMGKEDDSTSPGRHVRILW